MCQKANYYQIISYLCSAKSNGRCLWPAKHDFVDALIVQRIERGFPKPKIWVRFPVGVQKQQKSAASFFAALSLSL